MRCLPSEIGTILPSDRTRNWLLLPGKVVEHIDLGINLGLLAPSKRVQPEFFWVCPPSISVSWVLAAGNTCIYMQYL